jgi:hypothetical protein
VAGIIAVCLFTIASVHFYWGLRFMEGEEVLVPEHEGRPAYVPRHSEFLDVAMALILSSVIIAARGGFVHSALPEAWTHAATFAIGIALLARAVGDFRYVGFFKRVRDTAFAEWDTRLFSPVALLLGLATLQLALS